MASAARRSWARCASLLGSMSSLPRVEPLLAPKTEAVSPGSTGCLPVCVASSVMATVRQDCTAAACKRERAGLQDRWCVRLWVCNGFTSWPFSNETSVSSMSTMAATTGGWLAAGATLCARPQECRHCHLSSPPCTMRPDARDRGSRADPASWWPAAKSHIVREAVVDQQRSSPSQARDLRGRDCYR